MTATYNVKVDSFKITRDGIVFLEDPFDDGIAPPNADGATIKPPTASYLTPAGLGLTETGGKLVFDSSNAPQTLPAAGLVGQSAQQHQVNFNSNADPANTAAGLKPNHEFAAEAIFDLTLPLENQQEYGVRFIDGPSFSANGIAGLAVRRGTDGRLWVEITEREIVVGTITVKGRIELTPELIGTADQIKLTLSHDANSDVVTGAFELLTANVSAGVVDVGGEAKIFNVAPDDPNFTRAGVYTTNFNIDETRPTFVYEVDSFRIEKNGNNILVDQFNDGVAPPSINNQGTSTTIGNYNAFGHFSEVIEEDGNGVLVMDSALANSGTSAGMNLHVMNITAQTNMSNAPADAALGLKQHDDFGAFARFNLIEPEERSEYGIRLTDTTGPGTGDDVIAVSVLKGVDGIVRVVLSERGLGAGGYMEILGSVELTPALLGTADQIGLGLIHDADNPGVITAGFRLFDNGVELPGGPHPLPGFGRIFGTDTAITTDDEVWTRAQVYAMGADDSDLILIEGLETEDELTGTNADETFFGHAGNDTFIGGGGINTVFGGTGTDKVVLSGNVSDYTITAANNFFTLVDNRGGSPNGTINARGVENFEFANATLASSALLSPEIEVRGAGNTEIADDDTLPDGTDGTAFGNVNLGAALTKVFTINNLGGQPLTISGFTVPTGFTIVSAPPVSIPGGGTATFEVGVNSSTIGAKSGQITFTTNDTTDGENAYNFAISANVVTAPTPEIAVSGLSGLDIKDNDTTPATNDGTDFGSSEINSAGTQRTFTVTNSGAADLTISNFLLSAGFTLVEGLDTTIAIGASDTFTVELDTTAQGAKAGEISFTTNDPNESPFNFSIKGTVTATPEVEVLGNGVSIADNDLLPSTVDDTAFGDVLLGATATRIFTINNVGNGTLTISNLKAPTGFTLVGTAPTSVAPGGSATFEVQAVSSAVGAKSGQITFTTNDLTGGENAYNFAISANIVPAPTPEIAVSGLSGADIKDNDTTPAATDGTDFGSSEINSTGTQRIFTVTNSGTTDLNISNFLLSGGFTLVEGLDTTIAIGASDTFTVELDTAVQGAVTGAVSFTTNDPNESPFNFSLKGNVTATPEADVFGNATEIADGDITPDAGDDTAFGTHVLGDVVVHTFTVENNGNGVMNVSQLKLPKGFVLVGPTLPPTIPAGSSATFQVKLDTTKVGDFTGVISFKTNDTNESIYEFTVSGSVTQPEIDVQGGGLSIKDGSKKALAADHTLFDAGIGLDDTPPIRTFTISNAVGAADLTINSATLVGTGFTLLTPLAGTVLQGGEFITFEVELDTSIAGTRSATIQINNNDANEGLYDFVVTGTVGPRNIIGNDAVDDVFVATIDPERFDGKTGSDTVSYDGAGAVVASLLTQAKNTGFAQGDLYLAIENLIGSASADTLTGNTGDNVLEGGLGADKLDGGTGSDTASYENAGDAGGGVGVTADLLKATNNLGAAALGDTYKNIENLLGSAFKDILVGNTLNNALDGGDGDDTLTGNGGIDTLTGGLGADSFRFNAVKDGGGTTGDLITDFVSGVDSIDILRTGFKILPGVDLGAVGVLDFAAEYFVSAVGVAPSVANPSGVVASKSGHGQFLFNETTDQLWWDEDGSGSKKALLLATFQNGAHVTANDFDLL